MSDDEAFIDSILDEEDGRPARTEQEKSNHPKELIKGKPVVSKEGSQNIDKIKNIKREWAKLRDKTPGLRPYKFDEVHIKGDKIEIDKEKYNERLAQEEELMRKHEEITSNSKVENLVPERQLPQFDKAIGFKPYNEKKWDEKKELELV
jgi:hypothetical protein